MEVNEYKDKLRRIDEMDRMEVLEQLRQLRVTEIPWDSTQKIRLILKKVLLEEIIKVDDDQDLLTQLIDVSQQLNTTVKGYNCCLVGCIFKASRHKEYVRHIKLTHTRLTDIKCNFLHKCKRVFSNVDMLIDHIKMDHYSKTPDDSAQGQSAKGIQAIPCRCDLLSCGSKQFCSINELLKHLNTVHHGEARACIFEGCQKKFGSYSTSRHHFRIVHSLGGDLKPIHKVASVSSEMVVLNQIDILDDNLEPSVEEDSGEYEHSDIETLEDLVIEDCDVESDNYFSLYYADFVNRLAHYKFIPYSTVQEITDEYLKNSKKSQEVSQRRLRQSLLTARIPEQEIEVIVDKVVKDDFFIKAQEALNTEYKRTKFIHENMKYIAPVEIILNPSEVQKGLKKDSFHYIPLEQSLRALVQDESYVNMCEKVAPKHSIGKQNDLLDGSLYKDNKFFKNNHNALALVLYSDAVELKNPLGAARGTYKVVQVYYTLANIPKNQRSQVDRIQLLMVFREKLIKKYSYQMIYKRLIEDFQKLEQGFEVCISSEVRMYKAGLLIYVADNLEAHLLGKDIDNRSL